MEKKAYVYILQCIDDSYYTGWTGDLEKRWNLHCNGKGAKYTRAHKPVRLVYCQVCSNKSEAMRKEAAIKKLTHLQKMTLIQQANNCVNLKI